MKAKKILTVASACAMAMMVMAPGVLADDVPVSYNYSGSIEPISPNYAIDIPTGVVFDAKEPGKYIEANVKMTPAQGETAITKPSKASVKVKSKKGLVVSLDEAGKDDAIEYTLKYGEVNVTGTTEANIGVLQAKLTSGEEDVLELAGRARLAGTATKVGNHIDTLTYTITDEAVS